ncbi:uncharacterized protein LOC127284313 [Leptopilina boulardi]|uniref:uncharacterized protein LOC127284313 n=1 Tax=Leptopilina boulardi TaxID=63433 RepID=UPI0021F560ED|nr:uncharacterized protein LOC127284313 [Leptopilina boulardi]
MFQSSEGLEELKQKAFSDDEGENKDEVRGPPENAKEWLRKVFACVRAQNIVNKLRNSKGFIVDFSPWVPAKVRDSGGFWTLDRALRRSCKKLHSRNLWFQEYSWNEESLGYWCRGYWAPHDFTELSVVSTERPGIFSLALLKGAWKGEKSETTTFALMPSIPLEEGYQPLLSVFRLSFLQCHFWSRGKESRVKARWQIKFNVPEYESWAGVSSGGMSLGAPSATQ